MINNWTAINMPSCFQNYYFIKKDWINRKSINPNDFLRNGNNSFSPIKIDDRIIYLAKGHFIDTFSLTANKYIFYGETTEYESEDKYKSYKNRIELEELKEIRKNSLKGFDDGGNTFLQKLGDFYSSLPLYEKVIRLEDLIKEYCHCICLEEHLSSDWMYNYGYLSRCLLDAFNERGMILKHLNIIGEIDSDLCYYFFTMPKKNQTQFESGEAIIGNNVPKANKRSDSHCLKKGDEKESFNHQLNDIENESKLEEIKLNNISNETVPMSLECQIEPIRAKWMLLLNAQKMRSLELPCFFKTEEDVNQLLSCLFLNFKNQVSINPDFCVSKIPEKFDNLFRGLMHYTFKENKSKSKKEAVVYASLLKNTFPHIYNDIRADCLAGCLNKYAKRLDQVNFKI